VNSSLNVMIKGNLLESLFIRIITKASI